MIPQTFPSVLDSNNRTKMVIYMLSNVTGLTKWIDYIPVLPPANEGDLTLVNRYERNGFIYTTSLTDVRNKQAWVDYIPVFIDVNATKEWSSDNTGYIPMSGLASLLLDFTATNTLDDRVTFSRTSNATVTRSDGTIGYAPHNLLTFSEQFDNTAWTKTEITVSANNTTAPNGTVTADRIIESTTASATHVLFQSAGSANVHSLSFYFKPNGRSWVNIRIDGTSNYFNITTGALGTIAGGNTATIAAVGNGWYRCSIAKTMSGSGAVGLRLATADNTDVYTGDGTSGIFIWGAQLEVGASPTAYNPTTVKNLLGFTQEFDNAAWTKSNSFIQTNLLLRSEEFENASWSTSALTISANNIVSPDGYQNAEALIETTAASAFHFSQQTITKAASAIQYTFSIYVKAKGRLLGISVASGSGGAVCRFNPATGLFTQTAVAYGTWSAQSSTATLVGNGWYRVVLVGTSDTATSFAVQVSTYNEALNTNVYTGDGVSGFYLWGAQLVQGAVAGDYVRTSSTVMPVMYQAPTGTLSADKLVEDTATNTHFINQLPTVTSGASYTLSCYAKAGERNFVQLLMVGGFAANITALFDLTTGAVGATGGSPITQAINVGNGWWRFSITATATSTVTTSVQIRPSSSSTTAFYTGDGTSGIYIWGAQLSDSASLDPYVYNPVASPTAAAYYGARFDYDPVTLQPKGLLIEEQRSNLLLNSSLAGTNLATQSVTVTAVAHILSFYGTGTVTLSGTAIAVVVGTGAYPTRTTLTFTPTVGVVVFTVTGTVQFAQLEIGSFATSFIPTAASQVTRAADTAVIQGSNFSSWYNQNEGTMYADYSKGNITASGRVVTISNGTNNNQIRFSVVGRPDWQIVNGGSVEANVLGIDTSVNAVVKIAGVYKNNDVQASVNGTLRTEDTTATIPAVSIMHLGTNESLAGALNGTIKSINYYPTRLSNATLQTITS